ncbi:C39 family peptidase [Candidatus Sumerlaeota bacterium]|nr:C39 family peptidase [Candidatus Sumerlaeota bacterium]
MSLPSLLRLVVVVVLGFAAVPCHALFAGGKFDSPEEKKAVMKAECELDFRNYNRAWDLAVKASRDFPDSLNAARAVVSVGYFTGRIAEAFKLFDAPKPEDVEGQIRMHYAHAWAAVLVGETRGGRSEIVKAMTLAKDERFELQRVYLVLRRAELTEDRKALVRDYEAFVQKYNDVGLAHLSYINLYNFLDDRGAAQKRAVAAALAAPERAPETYLTAATLAEGAFWYDPNDGVELIDKALKEFPTSTELANRKHYYLRRAGRGAEALDLMRQWHRIAPNHGEFITHIIDLLRENGEWDEALAMCGQLEKVTNQPQYVQSCAMKEAEILHDAGRDAKAIEVLSDYVANNRSAPNWQATVMMLTRLQSAEPGQKVRILADIPYLQQRGNYCGPASLHMILHHYGIDETQDEIAGRVYTGVAGTPPQVLHHFAESIGMKSTEFKADDETWKRLLDAGYPILWLQMLGRRGGHYRVITGYDDVFKTWLVHDPNLFTTSRIPYDKIDDTWLLPSIRRSLIFFPADKAGDPLIAPLKPTPILFITNWIMYVATGANLFVGFFPALLVNILAATALAWIIARLMQGVSFPAREVKAVNVILATLLLVVPLNLMIGMMRWSGGVSALLSFNLALLTLIPLLLLMYLLRRLTHDYFHPRETIGLGIIITAMWISRSFLDVDPWSWIAPVAIMLLCLPVVMYPRLAIWRANRAMRIGDVPRALKKVSRYGSLGENYFSAVCVEIDSRMMRGEYSELVEIARRALQHENWPREHDRALRIHLLMGESLQADPDTARQDLDRFMEGPALSPMIRSIAQGLALYNDSRSAENMGADSPLISDSEIDALLERLDAGSRKSLPGLPISRGARGRPIQQAALILALTGAIRVARAHGDEPRRAALWSRWGNRFGMSFFLLKGLDSAITGEPAT